MGKIGTAGGAPIDPFPASEKTPGQRESRQAFALLLQRKDKPKWWGDYLALRDAGLTWRKAIYVAWAVSPVKGRWPKTIEELATEILGLRSARTIRKWRATDPRIDKLIAEFRMTPVMDHLTDSLAAMFAVAARHTPEGNRDRRLHFEIAGILKVRQALEIMGEGGGPIQMQDLDAEYRKDMEALMKRLNVSPSLPASELPEDEDDEEGGEE